MKIIDTHLEAMEDHIMYYEQSKDIVELILSNPDYWQAEIELEYYKKEGILDEKL